jgi:uncharacterized membrane protein YkvI
MVTCSQNPSKALERWHAPRMTNGLNLGQHIFRYYGAYFGYSVVSICSIVFFSYADISTKVSSSYCTIFFDQTTKDAHAHVWSSRNTAFLVMNLFQLSRKNSESLNPIIYKL